MSEWSDDMDDVHRSEGAISHDAQALVSRDRRSPLVSIIVNNFNYGSFVGQAIKSALDQDYSAVEIVVVDDGSTDGSREVIRQFEGSVRLVLKPNGGQASAVNTGFQACRGDLVLFLDSDDLLDQSCVSRVVARITDEFSLLAFNLRVVNASGHVMRERYSEGSLPTGDFTEAALCGRPVCRIPMSGNVFSRDFLLQVLPIPEQEYRSGADIYLFALAPLLGRIAAVQDVLGCYRVHGRNDSGPLRHGRLNHDWLDRQLRWSESSGAAIRSVSTRIGLVAPKMTRNMDFGHLQLRYLHDLGDHLSARRRILGWCELMSSLNKTRLPAYKKVVLIVWTSCLMMLPSKCAEALSAWGLRRGLFVSVAKFLVT